MAILVTSLTIPYLYVLHPHMGHPTTLGTQALHHLNPTLAVDFVLENLTLFP